MPTPRWRPAGPAGTRSRPSPTPTPPGRCRRRWRRPRRRPATARWPSCVDAARPAGPLHRPWRPMIGSEHLSHLLSTDRTGGRPIGEELAEALRIAHDELGVAAVRAHGILGDDLGTYREVDGRPVHDFAGIDRVYDRLWGSVCGRSSSWPTCPATWPATPTTSPSSTRGCRRPPRTGTAGPSWSATSSSTWSTATGSRRSATIGPSRSGTSPTSSTSGAATPPTTCACTTRRPARCARSTPACGSGDRPRPPSAGSRTCSPTPRRPACPWTSSPPTCTAPRRSISARPFTATAARTRPSGGPSGGPTRGCPTRWPSRCTRPRPWPGGCARPPAGSTPCPGGSSPTTSRSWAARRRCCTAGSGCSPWATCASRASGR